MPIMAITTNNSTNVNAVLCLATGIALLLAQVAATSAEPLVRWISHS